jgi:hypothetical protein
MTSEELSTLIAAALEAEHDRTTAAALEAAEALAVYLDAPAFLRLDQSRAVALLDAARAAADAHHRAPLDFARWGSIEIVPATMADARQYQIGVAVAVSYA